MSTINVQCTDQALAITNSPVIASGGIAENYIQFNFSQLWAGYAKIAVFYRQRGDFYYSLVDATDKCVIPAECCTDAGIIHFGVVGSLNGVVRTSEILTYKLAEGAVTEISDPSPDIYTQFLDELSSIRSLVENGTVADGAVTTAKLASGAVTNDKTDFSAGFAPTGYITLAKNIHYFDSEDDLPTPGHVGRVYLVKSANQ